MKGNIGAVVLILAGILALGANLGWFELNLGELLRTWWPLILIALGIGMFMTKETPGKPSSN